MRSRPCHRMKCGMLPLASCDRTLGVPRLARSKREESPSAQQKGNRSCPCLLRRRCRLLLGLARRCRLGLADGLYHRSLGPPLRFTHRDEFARFGIAADLSGCWHITLLPRTMQPSPNASKACYCSGERGQIPSSLYVLVGRQSSVGRIGALSKPPAGVPPSGGFFSPVHHTPVWNTSATISRSKREFKR